jgi:hypothetical protein
LNSLFDFRHCLQSELPNQISLKVRASSKGRRKSHIPFEASPAGGAVSPSSIAVFLFDSPFFPQPHTSLFFPVYFTPQQIDLEDICPFIIKKCAFTKL